MKKELLDIKDINSFDRKNEFDMRMIFNFGVPFNCPFCLQKVLVSEDVNTSNFYLEGNEGCDFCQDLEFIVSKEFEETVIRWNLIVHFIREGEKLWLRNKFADKVEVDTIIGLLKNSNELELGVVRNYFIYSKISVIDFLEGLSKEEQELAWAYLHNLTL